MNNKPSFTPTRQRGFTLVEVLVVIAILIALAALLFTGAKSAMKKADLTTTISRIQGLAQANALYAGDHGGKYVPVYAFDEDGQGAVQWHYNRVFLEPLIGDTDAFEDAEVFEGVDGLPEIVLDPVTVRAKKRYWSRISASFGYNEEHMPGGGWGQPNGARSHTMSSLDNPTETFAFITATDWIAKYGGRTLWKGTRAVEGKTEDGKIAYRHQGKAVVAYYDGHTATISMDEIRELDRKGGVNHPFWGGRR